MVGARFQVYRVPQEQLHRVAVSRGRELGGLCNSSQQGLGQGDTCRVRLHPSLIVQLSWLLGFSLSDIPANSCQRLRSGSQHPPGVAEAEPPVHEGRQERQQREADSPAKAAGGQAVRGVIRVCDEGSEYKQVEQYPINHRTLGGCHCCSSHVMHRHFTDLHGTIMVGWNSTFLTFPFLPVIVLVVNIIHEIKILTMSCTCTSVIQMCNVAWGNYEFNASQLHQGA